jgi:Tfp pilus assembly protein PilF
MADQFSILAQIYYRPHAAFCRVLDEGQFIFALIAAALASVLFTGLVFNSIANLNTQLPQGTQKQISKQSDGQAEGDNDDAAPPPIPRAGLRGFGVAGASSVFGNLIMMAGLYVPAAIILIAWWDALGGAATILRRDYLPVLTCHLLAFTASVLPLIVFKFFLPLTGVLALSLVAGVYFLVLSGVSLRAVMGTSATHAVLTALAASVAAGLGSAVYGVIGSSAYYLTSPFFLYYAYSFFQGDLRIIGSGLSSRQSLRRQLEASKLNPRDWDAHYQIGLIHAQRRQLAEAEASFKKAIEIAPDEPDPYFHLAKVAREQGRLDEAMNALRRAASLDDKFSSSEVWRDLGAVALLANHPEDAQPALAKYVQRRPYDPEGLYWYGKALKRLGQTTEAKEALLGSIEAVNTAPSHQRSKLRKWASEAKAELKSI